ncbi:GPN-loop GTPase 2 [Histomonas meleagridis]|uniref:GPN-loop GTPase 2 n=1 Tax=Histomonas meleagridis TaxID=135588 RepID=UPI00355A0712|nr:GPN-loop GTPase 2 [Histomonas meleagridis]KAH0804034.1 GPN-loop GTPase 2 [Histomonas meleagridis]
MQQADLNTTLDQKNDPRLKMSYGALFVGPPGSGKSTCVATLKEMCDKLKRKCIVINLDPANIHPTYTPNFDVCTIIDVKTTMEEEKLGPNGALMFCMETIAASTHEITKALKPIIEGGSYILIDCPGQVELYTHSDCMKQFIEDFQKDLNARLAVVNLVDIVLASTVTGFLGQSLMSLGTMLRLYTPHINVLSKFDLAAELDLPYDPFDANFDDFLIHGNADSSDSDDEIKCNYIIKSVPNKLHDSIVEILTQFDLVSYSQFTTSDETTVMELIQLIDKAVGCTWML